MSESKLIELGYYDPSAKIRLSAYADTVVLDPDKKGSVICAIRFGGYGRRYLWRRYHRGHPKWYGAETAK